MDPTLGRFTSADSIVPAGIQGWDRYAYANGNPVRYTDPSGHYICEDGDNCRNPASILADYGIATHGLNEYEKWQGVAASGPAGAKFNALIDYEHHLLWQRHFAKNRRPRVYPGGFNPDQRAKP